MRLLWLCNQMPGKVKQALYGEEKTGGLWVDHVLAGLRRRGMTIHILCPGNGAAGTLDPQCSYATFREPQAYRYQPELEAAFVQALQTFAPEVVHIWGSEFGHTLAMVHAAQKQNLLDHTVVSIQGLSWACARHYLEGIPAKVQHAATFRDLVRRDNLLQQQRKFALRGKLEAEALGKVRHVIGRTLWDRACTSRFHPGICYHFCNETLREPFYDGQWHYDQCRKHSVFASSCVYPVKGFHYLLEAFGEVAKTYPDAVLEVPGRSFFSQDWRGNLRRNGYEVYLAELASRYHLENRIHFLGSLNAQQMREAYLRANVFVSPSTIENSPNSLGEAMLLGLPCIASDVGGVTDLMDGKSEGIVYPSTEPYLLAYHIQRVFAMEAQAGAMGLAARRHALQTHAPEKNLETLLSIYQELA